MSEKPTNDGGIYISRRRLIQVGLGLAVGGSALAAEEAITGGYLWNLLTGGRPAAAPSPVATGTPAAATETNSPRTGMEVAQFLIANQCQVQLIAPAMADFATQTKTAVMQQKSGLETYNPEDLEELASIPADLGGAPESGFWRFGRDSAFIRTVWAPDPSTANTNEKLISVTTGLITTEQVVFSGLVIKPMFQDGISKYVRANYFLVQAVGGAACSTISAQEMVNYANNPGMADALAGQAQQQTIQNSPLK